MKNLSDKQKMSSEWQQRSLVQMTLDNYSEKIVEKIKKLAPIADKEKIIALVLKALIEARTTLFNIPIEGPTLPISELCASDLISRNHVGISATSLFEEVKDGHFYCLYRRSPKADFFFPTWQFSEGAMGRLHYILPLFKGKSDIDIYAFWIQESDQLNELTPAEMLVGIPFETRTELDPSQLRYLALHFDDRLRKVREWAQIILDDEGDADLPK